VIDGVSDGAIDGVVLKRLREQDRALVKVARKIRVLGTLGWPPEHEATFLASVRAGAPALPVIDTPPADLSEHKTALHDLRVGLDTGHPAGAFLDRTAASYLEAAEMLERAGTPAFTEIACAVYGAPDEPIHPGSPTHLDAASHFIRVTEGCAPPVTDGGDMNAEEAAAWLRERLGDHFLPALPVELGEGMAPLATAGSKRVRLRADARFSAVQLAQLLEHEALVHTATKRNGRAQPLLTSLGLSSPRTTCAQEGLATLAEMITDTMDLHRLRRIALRILAVDAGLEGADFIEVFQLFREAGQSESESYHSAARIFRGGDVRGGVVFTKDVVYLKGMLSTHTFLLKAMQEGRRDAPLRLFAGRMTLGDALALEPLFEAGLMAPPITAPDWVFNQECLAAYLAWTAFNDRIQLHCVSLEDFRDF